MTDCTRNCWIFAALMGLLVWAFALGQGGVGLLPGAFLGFVTAWLLGGLLVMLFCQGEAADEGLGFADTPLVVRDGAAVPPAGSAARRETTGATRVEPALQAPAGASADPRQAVTFESSTAVKAAEEAAEHRALVEPIRTGAPQGASTDPRLAVTFTEAGGADRAPVARVEAALTERDAAGPGAALYAEGQPSRPTRSTDAGQVARARRRGAAPDDAPRSTAAHLAAPRDGQDDDLSRILGIGPRLTEWLHDNGIRRFDQIAAWSPEDVRAWGDRLGRNGGRIDREDWVGQARILAAGGETAHSRRVDQGEST